MAPKRGGDPTDDHCVHCVDHIKKLPDADKAQKLLEEMARHINPLLKARGWRVLKLYEICCCTAGGKNLGVGGFCCPAGDKVTSRRIAIRLRTPGRGPDADQWGAHSLRDFDHCMRILIHEISHIVHGNHSAAFYELMAELTKQYETYKEKGVVLDAQGMPIIGGRKADESRHNPASMRDAREKALGAAEARAKIGQLMGGGGRLGGGGGSGSGGAAGSSASGGNTLGGASASSWRSADPREMAAQAAFGRQRQWDEKNGLEAAELEAANGSLEEDDEVEEVVIDESRSSSRNDNNGRSSSRNDNPGRSSSRNGGGSSSGDPLPGGGGIRWGAGWQKVDCPVCGPVCSATKHGPGDPPPQDADEGGEEGEAAPAPAAAAAAGGSSTSGGAAAETIDLTLSSDDEENGGGVDADATEEDTPAKKPSLKRPREDAAGESWMANTWACDACTLRNAKAESHCVACGTWRYSRGRPHASRATM